MKLVRCKCGDEHECSARLSNRERAEKAARARVGSRQTQGAADASGAHNPVPVGSTPSPATKERGCVRHPHKREEGCKWCETITLAL